MQRAVDPDFHVTGRWPRSAAEPNSLFFERDAAAIATAEDTKLAAFSAVPLSTITLKGFASEEETARSTLVTNRLDAVASRLATISPGTGTPTKVSDLASGIGQLDYRSVRRVEILVSGAASSVPSCAGGADIACGSSPNDFDRGHTAATGTLLPAAITALSTPTASPAKEALALFGGTSKAAAVKAGLTKINMHFANMLPAIPLGNTTAGGHRCINSCEGQVLAYNQGSGASARMTVGPQYFALGDPIRQGLVLIHEGAHGATGLTADDNAYDWQRLLKFLPPAVALKNADSFTRFVELIQDPAAPARGVTDDASALPMPKRRPALESLAWLEQWLVQGRLDVRALYSAAARATAAGGWQADDSFYRDHVMDHVASRFGATAPPAVPTADDKATIAGIFDRLVDVRFAVTGSGRKLEAGPAPSSWTFGPGSIITLSPGFFALTKKGKVERLLVLVMAASPSVQSGREASYAGLIKDLSPGFGGP